jgi:hypothetical protein
METVAASRTLPDATLRLHEIHPAYRPTRSGEQNHRAGVEEEVVGETGAPLAASRYAEEERGRFPHVVYVFSSPQPVALTAGSVPSMLPKHRKCPFAAWLPNLLGRAERSSPKAASRRAEGAGLDGQGADRAIVCPPQGKQSRVFFGRFLVSSSPQTRVPPGRRLDRLLSTATT